MKMIKKLSTLFLAFLLTLSCTTGLHMKEAYAAEEEYITANVSSLEPFGSIADFSYTGKVGDFIDKKIFIHLQGGTNAEAIEAQVDFKDWCKNLPEGVTLKKTDYAYKHSGRVLYLHLVGKPTKSYNGMFTIHIPASFLDPSDIEPRKVPLGGVDVNVGGSRIIIEKLTRNDLPNVTSDVDFISGVNNTMEYSIDGGASYTPFNGIGDKIPNLPNGDIFVRYSATDTYQASPATKVTINAYAVSGKVTGDYLPETVKFTQDDTNKTYIANVDENGNYSIKLNANKTYSFEASAATDYGNQTCDGTIVLGQEVLEKNISMKAVDPLPPGISGNLNEDINKNGSYKIALGNEDALENLLKASGIPHINSCVHVVGNTLSVDSNQENIELSGQNITAKKVGESQLSFNVNTDGCAFYGTTTGEKVTIKIEVILPENSKEFLKNTLGGKESEKDVIYFATTVTKDNYQNIIDGENFYYETCDNTDRKAIDTKLAPTKYTDMLAAAKFLQKHDFVNTVDSTTVDKILGEEQAYKELSDDSKKLVNAALTDSDVRDYPTILADAKQFVKERSEQFVKNYLNDLKDYDKVISSQETYKGLSNAEKTAINDLVKPDTYQNLLDSAYAEKFIADHMTTKDDATITTVERPTLDNIIDGEDDFNKLTDSQKALVNGKLNAAGSDKTYSQLLAGAKELVKTNGDKFIKNYASDEKGNYKEANANNYKKILSGENEWNQFCNAEKTYVNKALTSDDGGKTYKQLLDEAKIIDNHVNEFIDNYVSDDKGTIYTEATADNYEQILDGKDTWDKYTQEERDAINAILTAQENGKTYEKLLEKAKQINGTVNTFINEYVSDDEGTIYTEATADNYEQILDGKDTWDNYTQEERDAINAKLTAQENGKTYEELLKAAATIKEHVNEFIDSYVSDDEGTIYTEATADNYEQILDGKETWDKYTQEERDAINAILTAQENGKTYEELLKSATTINDHVNEFIDNYVSDDEGTIYTEATANNYGQILEGKDTWDKYTQEEKDAINAILTAQENGKTYEELLKNAEALFDNTVNFIATYLADDQGNIYKVATAKNYAQILSGKDTWDAMTQDQRDAINSALTLNGGKTYEELLKLAQALEDNTTSFIKKYVSNDKGIYKTATKDNYAQILSGKTEWNKMTQDQKDAINAVLVANGGKTYEELLKLAEQIKNSVKTSDETNYAYYAMMGAISLIGLVVLKKKKEEMI